MALDMSGTHAQPRHEPADESEVTRLSPVRLAVLGLLVESPSHRYNVAVRFTGRVGAAWAIRPAQIYEQVKGLEQDGLVERVPPTASHRSRAVYRSTTKGRETFETWLLREAANDPPPVRNSLFIRLAFLRPEHVRRMLDIVAARERGVLQSIQEYSEACPELGLGSDGPDWPQVGLHLILEGTVATLQSELRWLRRVRETLESLAAPDRSEAGR